MEKVKQMAPVTIYKSNQLGISINVEEHDESSDTFQEEAPSSNPFKRFEGFTSRDAPERNPETVSLVNSVETTTSGASGSGGGRRRTKRGRKKRIQARIYTFLEHPTGWKCFVYHMGV